MKIAVAMSGGMDSTMAAVLLKEEGHDITGITARLHGEGSPAEETSIRSAEAVAGRYGFPLEIADIREMFSSIIVDPFCREYRDGRTPNPCILCNYRIKFGKLLDLAKETGCEKIATGHYADISRAPTGRYYISMTRDRAKDQSYFLAMLSQEALEMALFPLGVYTKEEVRDMARQRKIPQAERDESQEICFIPENDYPGFIDSRGESPPPGDIVDMNGRIIGRHRGIHHYTIGQRRGLGISAPRPLYVIAIDPGRNTIVAGPEGNLRTEGLFACGINRMKYTDLDNMPVHVKTRSTQKPFRATIRKHERGLLARFDSPQKGISPGQTAVFYDDDMDIAGAGIIESGIRDISSFMAERGIS